MSIVWFFVFGEIGVQSNMPDLPYDYDYLSRAIGANAKKVRPAGFSGFVPGPDISKYTLYDGLVRLFLAHGALSVSGATQFAICVEEEVGIYFLPSSAEVVGSASFRGVPAVDSFIRHPPKQGKAPERKKRLAGRNQRPPMEIKMKIVRVAAGVTAQRQEKRRRSN